jgi:peptidoglycan/LPS O-acetylase OafA/YrhL
MVPANRADYRPQIDALRAIAVLAVLYNHFWREESQLGHLGVRLFFVISGFLITGILLALKGGVERGERARSKNIGYFYARRALRILPIYYLAIAAAYLLNLANIRSTILWHVLQASNLLFALSQSWRPWVAAHLWSLNVEEQFYLAWPIIVFFTPRRWLSATIIAVMLVAPIYRLLALALFGSGSYAIDIIPFASLDALGAGALLALVADARRARRWLIPLRVLGAAVFVLGVGIWPIAQVDAAETLLDSVCLLPMAAIVFMASQGASGPLGHLLNLAPLVALGRISYGVYLYHLFALAVLEKLATRLRMGIDLSDGMACFLIASSATIIGAALSWYMIERPINDLKRHFPYTRRPARALTA